MSSVTLKDMVVYVVGGRDGNASDPVSLKKLISLMYIADWRMSVEYSRRMFASVNWMRGKWGGPVSGDIELAVNSMVKLGYLRTEIAHSLFNEFDSRVYLTEHAINTLDWDKELGSLEADQRETLAYAWDLRNLDSDEVNRIARSTFPLMFIKVGDKLDMISLAKSYLEKYPPKMRPGGIELPSDVCAPYLAKRSVASNMANKLQNVFTGFRGFKK